MSEINTVNTNSTTGSVTGSVTTAFYGSCPYRLPCGYCEKMKSPCFYGGFEINKITCGEPIIVSYKDNNAVNVINKADSVII